MTRVHATSAVPGEDQEVREAAWAAGKLVAFVSAFEVVPRCRCGHPAAVVIRQSVETAGLSIREAVRRARDEHLAEQHRVIGHGMKGPRTEVRG